MRVFIEGVDGYVGSAVKRALLEDFEKRKAEAGEEGDEVEKVDIIGSISYEVTDQVGLPKGVSEAVQRGDLDSVCDLARTADHILLDAHASVKEASSIVKALKRPFAGSKSLVLVSTLLTWDRTPATNANEGEEEKDEEEAEDGEPKRNVPTFSESDFTKRKPSPTFLLQKTLESQVLALAHETLSTTVLAAGLLYGQEENLFHSYFRDAWLGKDAVIPDINDGCQNVIPTVHVSDLAKAAFTALTAPPSQQYVVVADQSRNTVIDVVSAIFSVLQPHSELTLTDKKTGEEELSEEELEEEKSNWVKYKVVPRIASPEETNNILLSDSKWSQLQCNLAFDTSESTVDSLVEEWVSREGLVANIQKVVEEFKVSRDLRPIRLVVMGPPGSGKSTLSKRVSSEYSIPVVSSKIAIEELLDRLHSTRQGREARIQEYRDEKLRQKEERQRLREGKAAEVGDEEGGDQPTEEEEVEEENEEEDPAFQEIMRKSPLERLAERVEICIEKKGRASNQLLDKAFRAKLLTAECLNHGYVLDAEGLTFAGLKRMLGVSSVLDGLYNPENGEEEDGAPETDLDDINDDTKPSAGGEEEGEDAVFFLDKRIAPTAIVVLDANDDALRERACRATGESSTTKDKFEMSLEKYRNRNADHLADTPLSFFEGTCKLESLFVSSDSSLDFAMEEKVPESSGDLESKGAEESKESKEDHTNNAEEMDSQTFENILMYVEQGGRPFNYHPTEEEVMAQQAKLRAIQLAQEEAERKNRIEVEAKRKMEESEKLQALEEHREQVARHEAELLEARSEPLRAFLLKHVMPTLSKGLVETCRVKPDDPIDFLAEFLFKNSAENESI